MAFASLRSLVHRWNGTHCRSQRGPQHLGFPLMEGDRWGSRLTHVESAPLAVTMESTKTRGFVRSSGPVRTMTPASGLALTFTWTPNCLVDQVAVEENIAPSARGPQPRWIIQS